MLAYPVHGFGITYIVFSAFDSHRREQVGAGGGVIDIGIHVYQRLDCGTCQPFLLFLMPPRRDKCPGREVP